MTILELANNGDYGALEALGFFGTDASLEESLTEYGLALKQSEKYEDEFTVIYKKGEVWDCLTQSPKFFTDNINEGWFDKSAFFSTLAPPSPVLGEGGRGDEGLTIA